MYLHLIFARFLTYVLVLCTVAQAMPISERLSNVLKRDLGTLVPTSIHLKPHLARKANKVFTAKSPKTSTPYSPQKSSSIPLLWPAAQLVPFLPPYFFTCISYPLTLHQSLPPSPAPPTPLSSVASLQPEKSNPCSLLWLKGVWI